MGVRTIEDYDFRVSSIHDVIETRDLSVSIKLSNYNLSLSHLWLKVYIFRLVLDEIANSNFSYIDNMKVTFE